jgi:hypothetical protein
MSDHTGWDKQGKTLDSIENWGYDIQLVNPECKQIPKRGIQLKSRVWRVTATFMWWNDQRSLNDRQPGQSPENRKPKYRRLALSPPSAGLVPRSPKIEDKYSDQEKACEGLVAQIRKTPRILTSEGPYEAFTFPPLGQTEPSTPTCPLAGVTTGRTEQENEASQEDKKY